MVRAIDVQNVLARTLDAERTQEISKRQPESSQEQFLREFQNQTAHKLQSVQDPQKPEDARIQDDEKSQGDSSRQKGKEPNEKEKDEQGRNDPSTDDECGRIIDIRA